LLIFIVINVVITRLETLMLGHNQIPALHKQSTLRRFPNLRALHLQDNVIGKEGVDALHETMETLNSIASLSHLRLIRNGPLDKVFEGNSGQLRLFLIARLPALQNLNLSDVRNKEREAAERFYLKWVKQKFAAEGDVFIRNYP